ncbi:hypothetical protein JTE90_002302 [Oedothorax gibbosus]|uniref:Retrovirus-related Pol polyprotein from type-1 retrotransposable element R1 n=1 Tax=Oedothorax gibbosus TaxID=931172 RepID=A0AAV6ULB1_9ARAC|nr:hypothetical protein JTE90_002302 [Oedothorax gibbosus]
MPRFSQCNLGRGKAATAELVAPADGDISDILLLQEPYLDQAGCIGGLPLTWRKIHRPHSQTAVVVTNAKFSVTQVHISNCVAAATITAGREVLTVISTYFSPALSLRVGLEELGTLLDGLDMSRVIIGGDFNAHHPNWGPVRNTHRALDRGVSVLSFATSRALLIWNDPNSRPTFRRGEWESWIDLTMSSPEIAAPQTWKVAENPLSDHNLILFQTGEQALPKSIQYSKNPHRLKKAARFFFNNYNNVSEMIERAPDKAAVDSAVEYLTEKLKETCAMKLKVTPKGRAPVHWWSPQLASFRNRCKALRRRAVRAGSAEEKEKRHIIFKRERAQYRRALLAAKRDCRSGYCKNAGKVGPWTVPYQIGAGKFRIPQVLGAVKDQNGHLTKDMASTIYAITEAIFPRDDPLTDSAVHCAHRRLANTFVNPCADRDFTAREISGVVKSLAHRKAPGLDGISMEFIKAIHCHEPKLLCFLFNACKRWAFFPQSWKNAKLVLLKNGKDSESTKAYRPICLLPALGKVLDKLLTQRVYFHLNSEGLLHPSQYGFRPGKSCDIAAHKLMGEIRAKTNKRTKVCIVSLDIAGAFDTVWWPSIMSLLNKAECPKDLFLLFEDYLGDRKVTYLNGDMEISKAVERGCPQGSCSGPLLWNMIADEALKLNWPDGCYAQAYADDIVLVVSGDTRGTLECRGNAALTMLKSWADEFKLRFNPTKTVLLPIAYGNSNCLNDPPRLVMDGESLNVAHSIRYLGVEWDSHLSFTPHINLTKERIGKLLNEVATAGKSMFHKHPGLLKEIYKGAIERVALYGVGAWGHRTKLKGFCDRLRQVQRICGLVLTRSYRTVSTEATQILAGIVPLDLMARAEWCKFQVCGLKLPAIDLSGNEVNPENFDFPTDLHMSHPVDRRSLGFGSRLPCGDGLEIFTDGSAINGAVGGAFVVCYYGQAIHSGLGRLEDRNSVFQAELTAIEKACAWVNQNLRNTEVSLFSDIRSGLQTIANPDNRCSIAISILEHIEKAKTLHVKMNLNWVKAHVGITGNELADSAAKEATELELQDWAQKLPKSYLRRSLKTMAQDLWQNRWNETTNGLVTKKFFPKVSTSRLIRGRVAQLATGHGRFPSYLQRFNFDIEGECWCGLGMGSSDHYLTNCTLLDIVKLRRKLKAVNDPLTILTHKANQPVLNQIVLAISKLLPNPLTRE